MNPEIKAYLDEHGATYTPEALHRALVDAGHDPATVDLALREWQANRAGSDHSKEDRRTFGRWAFALHLGALVAMFALVVLLKGTTAIGLAVIAAFVLGIALLIGWAISSLIGRALLPRVGLMIALIVPLISALALSGTCVALMNASIPTPPRNGSMQLQILPPRTFDGTGVAACYLREGGGGVEVNSQELGTLDGKGVGVNLSWYGDGSSSPKDLSRTFLSIFLNSSSETELPESYSTVPSTRLEVRAAADSLSGTMQFEGLAAEPIERPAGEATPEPISGSVSWTCE
jgi:hypothetical protein